MQKPQLLHTLIRHTGWIEALAFSPDGHRLASSAADKTIRLWAVNNGMKLLTLAGHMMDVTSLAFSPDGSILASGAETVKVWDTTGGQLLHTFDSDAVKKFAQSHMLNNVSSV